MLKRLYVILLTTMLATTLQAESLVKFGIKGGMELMEMDFNSDALRESNRAGFYIGPILKFQLPVVGLTVDASVMYNQRDLKVEGESVKQQSLLLPANVHYGVGVGDVVTIFASAGPQICFNLGDDIFQWKDKQNNNNKYSLQNTLISFNVGLGVTLAKFLEAGVYYNIPTGNGTEGPDVEQRQVEEQRLARRRSFLFLIDWRNRTCLPKLYCQCLLTAPLPTPFPNSGRRA